MSVLLESSRTSRKFLAHVSPTCGNPVLTVILKIIHLIAEMLLILSVVSWKCCKAELATWWPSRWTLDLSLIVNILHFLSLQRSPTRDQGTQRSTPPYTSSVHPPPSVFMPSHQGGDRLSPGSLDMRLTAELNKLEYMEESVRQLTDVERTRAVSLAQQETVSLAQILKVVLHLTATVLSRLKLVSQLVTVSLFCPPLSPPLPPPSVV